MKNVSRETRFGHRRLTASTGGNRSVIFASVVCLLTSQCHLAPNGVVALAWDSDSHGIVVNGTFFYDSSTVWTPHRLLDGNNFTNRTLEIALSTSDLLYVGGRNRSVVYHLDARQHLGFTSVIMEGFKSKHMFLMSAAAETFMSTTALASMSGPRPVLSIIPFHYWHVDGTRFSNGFIPRFGQELKGRALADLLLQSSASLNIRTVLVVKDEQASPELKIFDMELESFLKLEIPLSVTTVSPNSLNESLRSSDVVIVDCRLEHFEPFASILVKSNVLSQHAWIVFMQDFAEIQSSTSILKITSVLKHLDIQLFAFCQTVRERLGSCSNFSSPASIYYHLFDDLLTIIGNATISSDFDGSKVTYQVLHLSTENATVPILTDGAAFVEDLGKQCMATSYGKLALTTGRATLDDCSEASRVQFQLLLLQSKSNWAAVGRWNASRHAELSAKIDAFARGFNEKDSLDFTRKLKVLFGNNYPPFTHSNLTHNYSGVDFDLLYLIADKIGIQRDNIEFTEWDITKYKYSDMIATVGSEDSEYDMAIGGITATPKRAQTSNFTRSYLVPGIGVLTKRPGLGKVNFLWRFLEPFTWTVWMVLLGMVGFTAVALKWFGVVNGYSSGLWLSSIILFNMNENRLVTISNPFGKIYLSALSIMVLVLVSSYTANMATFLTSSQIQSPIEGLSSLKRQMVAVDFSFHSYVVLKEQTGLRHLVPVTGNQYLELFASDDIVAYVSDTPDLVAIALKQSNCDLYVLEEENFQNPYVFAISDKLYASHGPAINEIIVDAVANQLVSTWFDQHLNYGATCEKVIGLVSDEASRSGKIDVDNLGGVFIITVVAAGLCLLSRGLLFLKQQFKRPRIVHAVM